MSELAVRISDFLHKWPPFSYLPLESLQELAAKSKVIYLTEGEILFEEGKPSSGLLYTLNKGSVELYHTLEEKPKLVDIVDDGDVFGGRAMLSGNPYITTAKATEDTLLYAVPRDEFVALMEAHPRVALFFAAGYAAGQPIARSDEAKQRAARKALLFTGDKKSFREEDVLQIDLEKEVVCGLAVNTIQEVAQVMTEYKIGSLVIIDEAQRPIGIVTDRDFTRKVMVSDISRHSRVTQIMSSPVLTVSPGITVADAILTMMRHNIRHLVVTGDGTADTPIVSVISERDVLQMQGNNPAILVKNISKTVELDELRRIRDRAAELTHNYLLQEVSIPFVAKVMTEINDALIERAVKLAREELAGRGLVPPDLPFAWLSLGSEGRREQLLRTDQDNALIYGDPHSEAEAEAASEYFAALAEGVNQRLEAFGYEKCPADIMARNPKWNMPLAGWKKQFDKWMLTPEPMAIMHGAIFFDFRRGYGDPAIVRELADHLYERLKKGRTGFLRFMAQNALQNPPPLSFFKNFIVERSGEQVGRFDIKLRAMMPLADAARLLALDLELFGVTSTFQRFERAAEQIPTYKTLLEASAMAYELFMRYRALNGFEHGNSGRYLDPKSLNKIERQSLKNAFGVIDDLQGMLRSRYGLNIFG